MKQRILVIHTGGIGDLLLAFPALAELGREGEMDIAGRPERAALAVAWGLAARALDLDTLDFASVFSGGSPRLHKALASYATAVVWMRDPDGAIRRALEQAGVSRVACFPGLPPEGWNRHASLYYLACLGIEHAQPPQPLPQSLLYSANAERKHRVYLHPGSGSKRKNWPIEQFAALARRLTAVHLEIRWILGPAEEDAELPAGANPVRCDSLLALARLLAQARLYVGNDSGITHLAALCGCPTLAIFGPTNPRVWAPLGQSVQVMHGRPWPDVQQVVAAAEAIARPAANKRRRSSR